MNEHSKPRYGIDPYLEWVGKEGLAVVEDYGIDLFKVETAVWPRYDVKAAAVHLKGRGDFANMFLFDIAPGGSTAPQRHLYEEAIYVLDGSGSTQLEFSDGRKRSFEWGPKSLFAIPLNAKHRHFNASGRDRALLVSTTDLPLVMNTFHNEDFIFQTEFDFSERAGKNEYYSGEGDLITVRPGNHMWETNFVPDLASIELKSWGDRGAGGTNIMFVLADGTMHAHISEMPVGTYKKGHRHGPGFHVMCVTGHGYSLLWFDDGQDSGIDWNHGVVFAGRPAIHQHFNTSNHPHAISRPGWRLRYPLTLTQRRSLLGVKPGEGAVSTSIREAATDRIRGSGPAIHRIRSKRCTRTMSSRKWKSSFRPGACNAEADSRRRSGR